MRVHSGLIIGLVAVLLVYVLMKRTVWGMEIRAVGENAPAARYAGIPVTATVIRVALLSGALAGLAGIGEVAGLKGYLTADLSPGFGYAGIVVAMLAGLSPLGVVAPISCGSERMRVTRAPVVTVPPNASTSARICRATLP